MPPITMPNKKFEKEFKETFGFIPAKTDPEKKKVEILLVRKEIENAEDEVRQAKYEKNVFISEWIDLSPSGLSINNKLLEEYDELESKRKEALAELKRIINLAAVAGYNEEELEGFE